MSEPTLDSMTFLNEVVDRYPNAISFAPGRPSPELFGVAESLNLLRKHAPAILGRPDINFEESLNNIAQYGRTTAWFIIMSRVHASARRAVGNRTGLSGRHSGSQAAEY